MRIPLHCVPQAHSGLGGGGGGNTPKVFGGVCDPHLETCSLLISDQNLWSSTPFFRPKPNINSSQRWELTQVILAFRLVMRSKLMYRCTADNSFQLSVDLVHYTGYLMPRDPYSQLSSCLWRLKNLKENQRQAFLLSFFPIEWASMSSPNLPGWRLGQKTCMDPWFSCFYLLVDFLTLIYAQSHLLYIVP